MKLLEEIGCLSDVQWEELDSGWQSPFYPKTDHEYFSWPELTNLFPWQHSGAQFKRTWPIAEEKDALLKRWIKLSRETNSVNAAKLFKETGSRDMKRSVADENGNKAKPVKDISDDELEAHIGRYLYRQFDKQWAVLDNRFADRFRPDLARVRGPYQLFLNTMMSKMLGKGAAIGASAAYPDLHVFCGRGGKDVVPLYRDAEATKPNVTAGLLAHLSKAYGFDVTAEDLAAYVYALLGGQSYTARFWNELETPGPRVPVTKDGAAFTRAAMLGRRLIWLHTYAERFRGEDRGDEVPVGSAKNIAAVFSDPARYPVDYVHDPEKREVRVGDGRFGPIAPEIWEFEISGLKVVQSWLGYRMKVRAGKKSSPLDAIRPERWTPRMTDEFLELLWVLEATLAMEPQLSAALDAVVVGECLKAEDLPQATEAERTAPGAKVEAGGLLSSMEADDLHGDDA